MANWNLYTPYKCKHCGQGIVTAKCIGKWNQITYLPINYKIGDEIPEFIDFKKNKSHLLECPGLQAQWQQIQNNIIEQVKKEQEYENRLFMR